MLPRKLDITIAFKMINLMPELSGADKRVAAAIIDHFNHKTAQCDPGLERLARLLGLSRRTVIRSVSRIEETGILRKVRHGGHLLRNSYEPVWRRFRELEAAWQIIFKTKKNQFVRPDMSPEQCPPIHLSGGQSVTQTFPTNQSNKLVAQSADRNAGVTGADAHWQPGAHKGVRPVRITTRSQQAMMAAAERRWNEALHNHFSPSPEIYAQVIGAIDEEMQSAATAAEVKMRGAGIAYILEQLRVQGL
jgi:AraC-like DNA-binding protein